MKKFFQWIRNEFLRVLPVVIFFFLALNIINISQGLMFRSEEITTIAVTKLLIGSFVAGKLLLVLDWLPFVNAFPNKPLIYNTLWKTMIYSLGALVYRWVEQLLPFVSREGSLQVGYERFAHEYDWSRFWGVQILVTVLMLVFVAFRELIILVGPKRVYQVFLIDRHSPTPSKGSS